ncbi:MAG: zinc-ribbon domain-containing protein [Deltaproteobacteria bacterium]|jgi:hypothetical protein|nr:zinc-ribbon domain-containing protein [Deltaproteobacteria bacterium]
MDEKKFCNYCGAELSPDDKFCGSCGHNAEPDNRLNNNPISPPKRMSNKNLIIMLSSLAGIVLVIFIVLIISLNQGRGPSISPASAPLSGQAKKPAASPVSKHILEHSSPSSYTYSTVSTPI